MSGTKPFGYPRIAGPRTSSNIAAGKDCPVCVQKLRGDHSLGVFAFCRFGTCGLTCRFEAASPTSDAAWTATVEQLLFLGINRAQRPRRRGIVSCAKAPGPGLPVNLLIDRNIPERAIGRAFCARFRLGTLFAIACRAATRVAGRSAMSMTQPKHPIKAGASAAAIVAED